MKKKVSKKVEKKEEVQTVTIEGVEYVHSELSKEVQERIAVVAEWHVQRDNIAKAKGENQEALRQLSLEEIKINLALSVLGDEISKMVVHPEESVAASSKSSK